MEPILEVKNISKKFRINEQLVPYQSLRESLLNIFKPKSGKKDFWALKDISFNVEPGETLGIIGKNGAGKSTLLKVLSRITPPTNGKIISRGRIASLLEVGTGFHPELTGRENIFLNGSILGMKRSEIIKKLPEIIEFSGVQQFIDTPLKHYSSGMQLRLAFSVAAFLEPEILIIDEVLAVGDAEFQKKCMGKMEDVTKSGRTILFVSHNLSAVVQMCKKAIWIKDGNVMMEGPSDLVVKSYLEENTQGEAEKNWTIENAPGDDKVRLLGCRLVQQTTRSVIDINEAFEVELNFEAQKDLTNLIAGVSFFNSEGTYLFASCDWKQNFLKRGRYRKSIQVPPHIFAEGQIRVLVQLVFFDPSVRSVFIPDALTFTAIDSDHPGSVRGLYKDTWPGVLRLGMQWSDFRPEHE